MNATLFEVALPHSSAPGEIVFCPREGNSVGPRELKKAAQALFQLKGTEPDDDLLVLTKNK